ncbi:MULTISPECIES: FecR family protein [Sphingobacterium]|uniref:FecR family protein n=1 Tax=Sphingobacterium TaxID=28453 RepID=UPI0013DB675C|nr:MULTISPECIES: FecR domain-containing protein [unclassified Sphingobacterium]
MEEKYIAYLYQKYLLGILSIEEQDDWYNVVIDEKYEYVLSRMIDGDWSRESLLAPILDQKDQQALFEYIIAHDQPISVRMKVFKIVRIAAVACLAVIISTTMVWMHHQEQEPKLSDDKVINSLITPGKTGATLTLADGTRINLTESENGELSTQKGVSIKKGNNGQLTYIVEGDVDLNNRSEGINTLSTDNGETYRIQLPDGSQVWLNAASNLSFSSNLLRDGQRTVRLKGEAYFEVTKDKKHPFVVETNNQNVEVLGTHFNITAYEDKAQIATTLLEGKVRVHSANKSVLLKPGQQALSDNGKLQIKTLPSPQQMVAWKNGEFSFDNLTLHEIMMQISRWYDVEISYAPHVSDPGFGGTIKRSKSIDEVLKALEKTQGIKFKIEGRRIHVMP